MTDRIGLDIMRLAQVVIPAIRSRRWPKKVHVTVNGVWHGRIEPGTKIGEALAAKLELEASIFPDPVRCPTLGCKNRKQATAVVCRDCRWGRPAGSEPHGGRAPCGRCGEPRDKRSSTGLCQRCFLKDRRRPDEARPPKTSALGRPSKMTASVVAAIVSDMAAGIPMYVAARRAGVSRTTVMNWQRHEPTLVALRRAGERG